ncbi:helix-turn-helix domain-containing protein [Massilia sp. LC238]|uniref:helix-turn-helix domain-containing protein n=2 Tax=Massilia TaxID=149698 RepID=UPI0004E4364D|nr:helix-turn-helix domain-containing protein [Massilia sp. LC238]KFC65514.1 hypothetical protein FG94_03597 [Massilia sp. LC238]
MHTSHTVVHPDPMALSERPDVTNKKYPALDAQVRIAVSTAEAAFHLGRKPQTLRKWACFEDGPIRPVRINGRLAWPVAQIKQLLNKGDA